LWQSTISSKFGNSIAKQAGAAHEDNPVADTSTRTFDTSIDSDTVADLLNNEIGRQIGTDNPDLGMKDLALKTLETFHKDGLFTVSQDSDGKYNVNKTKIDDKQYEALKKRFNQLNNNGRTEKEERR